MLGGRVKRQETDEEELERQLCEGKGAGEWFRLETGNDKCRDVIQCTASVRMNTDRIKQSRAQTGSEKVGWCNAREITQPIIMIFFLSRQ